MILDLFFPYIFFRYLFLLEPVKVDVVAVVAEPSRATPKHQETISERFNSVKSLLTPKKKNDKKDAEDNSAHANDSLKRSHSKKGDISTEAIHVKQPVNTLMFDDYYEPVVEDHAVSSNKLDSHASGTATSEPMRRAKVDLNSSLSHVLPIEAREREKVVAVVAEPQPQPQTQPLPQPQFEHSPEVEEELTYLKNVQASLSLKTLEKKNAVVATKSKRSHSKSSTSSSSSSSNEEKERKKSHSSSSSSSSSSKSKEKKVIGDQHPTGIYLFFRTNINFYFCQ